METLLNIINRILNPTVDLSWLKKSKAPLENRVRAQGRLRARHILFNLPLILGAVIVLALFFVVLFGPLYAPENPYFTGQRTITYQAGELIVPPFPPSDEYVLGTDQWGRDILSLLLYGTRNTLVACTFIAMTRLLLGILLGAIAGWNEGYLFDRLIMGIIGLTTALPILLSSMILILALDIRRGLPVFIVAMSIVGWAEIAQYIRSEFLVLRQKPFIEGARAIGIPSLGIAVRHILPNILPQLIVITLLEMGAVLMLLGELGFIGIFIGGGTQTEGFGGGRITIPDIPEWGAMMADSRRWARAKPWMVFYPSLAFFIAVVGFNTFAEGLRRLVEQATVNMAFLLRKRMVIVIFIISFATVYIINTVGPAPSYAKLATMFNSDVAYQHIQTLTALDGRGNGQPGNQVAATYIADKFAAYGLQPAGQAGTYFHTLQTQLVHPQQQPIFAFISPNQESPQQFQYQRDFGFVIQGHGGSGNIQAPLVFMGFDPTQDNTGWHLYRGLDLKGKIILLLADNAPPNFATEALIRGAVGIVWIVEDAPDAVHSQIQLANPQADYVRNPTLPIFRIRLAIAETILAASNLNLADLRTDLSNWSLYEDKNWFVKPLVGELKMTLQLSEPEDVELNNVLGYLPGQDIALDDQLVIVTAHYDGLGRDPNGLIYPAANDNTSGVAVLLETIRVWQERGLTPRRSVLFVVWTGAELEQSGAKEYFESYRGGLALLPLVAIFQLDNLGAGGDQLRLSSTSERLTNLVSDSAAAVGLSVSLEEGVYHPYQTIVSQEGPSILISWTNSQVLPHQDVLERIDSEKLRLAGETFILTLTSASRLPNY